MKWIIVTVESNLRNIIKGNSFKRETGMKKKKNWDVMHFNWSISQGVKNVDLTVRIISGTVFQKDRHSQRNLIMLERGGVKASLSALVIPFGFSTAV